MKSSTTLWAQAIARAKRDGLYPIPCQRLDTSEAIWLVQSRSDPSYHYLLTMTKQNIQCPCPQAQHRGICAHAAAVRLTLQAVQPPAPVGAQSNRPPTPSTHRRFLRSESQR